MTPTLVDTQWGCALEASGAIELYFYDDLPRDEHEAVARHMRGCADCRLTLQELTVIQASLAERPDVAAPPEGDWSGFIARLDHAVARESWRSPSAVPAAFALPPPRPSYAAYLAMAALLTLVTMSVLVLVLVRSRAPIVPAATAPGVIEAVGEKGPTTNGDAEFAAISERHFERSKLVVLGLATKDAHDASREDWKYERELASSLLSDTRLYRLTAEDRGLDTLAAVMRDLELVLLQTALTRETDSGALAQIQRLIQKRDLLEKMDVVSTMGTSVIG